MSNDFCSSITKEILDSGVILRYINIADPGSGDYFVKDISSLPNVFYEDFFSGQFISEWKF